MMRQNTKRTILQEIIVMRKGKKVRRKGERSWRKDVDLQL